MNCGDINNDQSRGRLHGFFLRFEYTSCFDLLLFYILVYRFVTIYGLQKVCFDPYKSEKHLCWNDIDFSVMPRLIENQRLHAIGMLQAGLAQNIVARHLVFIATQYSHC
jgi:hypothetical protein